MFFVRGRLQGFSCYTRHGFRESPLQSIDIQPIYCRVSVVGTVFAYAIAHGGRNTFCFYSWLIINMLLTHRCRDTLLSVGGSKIQNNYFCSCTADEMYFGSVAKRCGIDLKAISLWGNSRQPQSINHLLLQSAFLGVLLTWGVAPGWWTIGLSAANIIVFWFRNRGRFYSKRPYSECYSID